MKMKQMISMLSVVAMCVPTVAFAATDYETTTSDVVYEAEISEDKDTNTVNVSVSQGSTFSVIIPKTIVLDGTVGSDNDADYTITVTGNIASDEVITVAPDTEFKMADVKGVKADIDATVTQPVTKFVNDQAKSTKYADATDTIALGDTAGNVKVANLTAGSWAGQFNFNIKLDSVTF